MLKAAAEAQCGLAVQFGMAVLRACAFALSDLTPPGTRLPDLVHDRATVAPLAAAAAGTLDPAAPQ